MKQKARVSSDKISDLRAKYLEMIQAVISRIASNSAALKNWCLTATTAICGFAITLGHPLAGLVALIPIVIFGLLDARYLKLERGFRSLFDAVRKEDWGKTPTFEIRPRKAGTPSYLRCIFNWSVIGFYGPLAVLIGLAVFFCGVCAMNQRDNKSLGSLLSALAGEKPTRPRTTLLGELLSSGDLPPLSPDPWSGLSSLGGSVPSFPPPVPRQTTLAAAPTVTKRKAFFSFNFEDVMRVNNVRQAWKIDHPDSIIFRSFYDSSLWENKKLESDESIKKLIREGVEYSSSVCVLVGSDTWQRRWVRYEIARSVVDRKGLLAVHINGLKHHIRRVADTLGPNPLDYMGVGKTNSGSLILYEKILTTNQWTGAWEYVWRPYPDYMSAVPLPKYLSEPLVGYVHPLSVGTMTYDYCVQQGYKNIGSWIDHAATAVGR